MLYSLEQKLLNKFLTNGWTLAFAESCTGGDLAARLTKIPNASKVLRGSIVTYSREAKVKFLGVTTEKIVSKEAAVQMAQGLLKNLPATVGVSVTGYMGPAGGTEEAPLGTVFIAIQKSGEAPEVYELHLKGERVELIHQVGDIIFEKLIHL